MTTNPNNYIGVSATIVGYTSGAAQSPAYDKDGSRGVLEISIPINEGYKKGDEFIKTGTTWYSYSAAGDYAQQLRSIPKGSKVRIDDAKQEVREFSKNDGTKQLAIGLRFGTLTVLTQGESQNQGQASTADGEAF